MCEIVSAATMAGIFGAGASALTAVDVIGTVGTIATVAGAFGQSDSTAAAAKYQAQVARNNQIIAGQQAQDAIARGQVAEQAQRRQVGSVLGAERAGYGASGVSLSSGSPLDIQGDTAQLGELDALTLRSNAQREAAAYRAQGSNFGAEAGFYSARAQDEINSRWLNVGSTFLGSATPVAARYYDRRFLPLTR